MATWKSVSSVKYDEYTGLDYAKCEMSWTYGTVADILTVNISEGEYSSMGGPVEAKVYLEHMSRERALALLETLIDWAETYEREGIVQEMLEKRK